MSGRSEYPRPHQPLRARAACAWCRQEMTTARSCTVDALHVDGRRIAMIRYRAGRRAQQRRRIDE